ncbi:putative Histidine protein methyltransferase 1-like protein [Hypsibius exemplaris]|uniref:protein-histidine N-methyltransferase n=1 Tax=Hypsibius exemplaris TaxID=2072580 RepID=A0A1W0WYU7_HYPEX|nr:putative Histidine protein methyltransferase 1-like protein [Hypsibius exemplaris]
MSFLFNFPAPLPGADSEQQKSVLPEEGDHPLEISQSTEISNFIAPDSADSFRSRSDNSLLQPAEQPFREHIFAWDKGQPNDVSRFSESLTASRSPSNPACHSPASLTRSSSSTLEPSTKRVKRDVLVSNGDNRNDSSSASEAGTSRESKTLLDNNDSLCFPTADIRSDNLLSVPTAHESKDDISDQDASPHPSEAETSRESKTLLDNDDSLFFPTADIRSDNLLSVPNAHESKDDILSSRSADQDASSHPSEAKTSRESEEPLGSLPRNSETVWNAISVGGTTLEFICPQWLESVMDVQQVRLNGLTKLFGSERKSDIVPRIYEGGFRVWDGACDMLSFLSTEKSVDLSGKKVLELGCGAGLPAIYALANGATVHLHDYNSDVIELATIPNIRRNMAASASEGRVKLYSGDWMAFVAHLRQNSHVVDEYRKFDVILTSDTVYRKDVLEKLCGILPSLLRKNGLALVAGKSHYFGLDGGTDAFREALTKQGLLTVTASREYPDSLRREILTVEWKA